jgi:hypothetical protein
MVRVGPKRLLAAQGVGTVMSRVVAVLACGFALAGCSMSMPSLDYFRSGPVNETLRVESEPPGADARTTQGQSCRTPCELSVASGGELGISRCGPKLRQRPMERPDRRGCSPTRSTPSYSRSGRPPHRKGGRPPSGSRRPRRARRRRSRQLRQAPVQWGTRPPQTRQAIRGPTRSRSAELIRAIE